MKNQKDARLEIKEEKIRFFWVNYLRMIAVFGVVLVHVTADVITEWGAISPAKWWIANLYDSLFRGCVPMFIMISGALLLPKQESIRAFFQKRFNRIFIPFLFWTIMYLVWKKIFYDPGLGLWQALGLAFNGGVWFHLWFMYILTGLYLITPIFRILIAHARRTHIAYFLGIWFALGSLLPFIDRFARFFGLPGVHIDLSVGIAQGFLGYFVLGCFLMKYTREKWTKTAGIVWLACLFICFFGTGWLTMRSGSFQLMFYDNLSPNIVFYCASFFVIIKTLLSSQENRIAIPIKNFILTSSKASFGIYLIHPMIIDILDKGRLGFFVKSTTGHPLITIPAIAIFIYFISFFIITLRI